MPNRIDACRCGATRADAVQPAAPDAANLPADPAPPAQEPLSAVGFGLRIALAVIVFGGLGAGWYAWNLQHAAQADAQRAKVAEAIARRVNPSPVVKERESAGASNNQAPNLPPLPASAPAADAQADAAASTAAAPAPTVSLEDLVARVAPAVVAIETTAGRGSGFFVEPDTIITNAHVVGSDVSVKVRRVSGDPLNARVERVATDLDLAMLKLAAPLANQPTVSLGTIARVRSGEDVVAIGSALGVFQNSVTRGIVSAVRRNGNVTLIQTDAAINHGNSGGPLFDRSGLVIGINTMGFDSAQNVSFAIAADHARELLSGAHVATTASTPLSTLNETYRSRPDTPDPDLVRAQAARAYDQFLARLARRADELDIDWRRFKQQCYEGRVAGIFDREWFSIFDPKAMQGAVSPGCGPWFNNARSEAYLIRNSVEAGDEAARKSDVYPGTRRELRRKYRLDYSGWDR